MDQAVLDVLRGYDERSSEESKRAKEMGWEKFIERRDEFLLSVGPATGQLLHVLAQESKAQTILEVGTSYGYSTIWLADAARETGGKVITLDLVSQKQDYARREVERAGLGRFVEFRLGDARDLIARLDAALDLVLLDLWKDLYIPCFDLFYPKLSAGALIVADNMIYPESANAHARAYRRHVRSKKDMESVLLPVGSGLDISRCVRGDALSG